MSDHSISPVKMRAGTLRRRASVGVGARRGRAVPAYSFYLAGQQAAGLGPFVKGTSGTRLG